ncbi:hypothetical protein [Streptomyces sp. SS]
MRVPAVDRLAPVTTPDEHAGVTIGESPPSVPPCRSIGTPRTSSPS